MRKIFLCLVVLYLSPLLFAQMNHGYYMLCAKDRISLLKLDTNKKHFSWELNYANHNLKSKGKYEEIGDTLILNPHLDIRRSLDSLVPSEGQDGSIRLHVTINGKEHKSNYDYKLYFNGAKLPLYMKGKYFEVPDTVKNVRLHREGLLSVDIAIEKGKNYTAHFDIEQEKTTLIRSVHLILLNDRTLKTLQLDPMKLLESRELEYFYLDDKKEIELCEYYKNMEALGIQP